MRHNACAGVLTMLMSSAVLIAHARLTVMPDTAPHCVFAGDPKKITVKFHNDGARIAEAEVTVRTHQASSATAVRIGDSPWKRIQALPGQTILETAQVSFPAVKAETRFLVQWVEGTNRVLGTTEVLVFPTNLLAELARLAGDEPFGVFDPHNQLKPLLKMTTVEFVDLEDTGFGSFHDKLVIVGPFESKARMGTCSAERINALTAKGVAVVWIQPPPERHDKLQPSFYTVTVGRGSVVIVQAEVVADLAERPQSQLNLIHFARLALHPEPARLPHLTSQSLQP